ncbi:hypothetical protein GH866_25150 [Bacillus thuringiensis]|nr:hypothetical protein [Bacillus cereus]MRC18869.1 hypothetical protein [Bacillus thuringiensis]
MEVMNNVLITKVDEEIGGNAACVIGCIGSCLISEGIGSLIGTAFTLG